VPVRGILQVLQSQYPDRDIGVLAAGPGEHSGGLVDARHPHARREQRGPVLAGPAGRVQDLAARADKPRQPGDEIGMGTADGAPLRVVARAVHGVEPLHAYGAAFRQEGTTVAGPAFTGTVSCTVQGRLNSDPNARRKRAHAADSARQVRQDLATGGRGVPSHHRREPEPGGDSQASHAEPPAGIGLHRSATSR